MSEVVSNKALADKDEGDLKDGQQVVRGRRGRGGAGRGGKEHTDETKEESGRGRGGRRGQADETKQESGRGRGGRRGQADETKEESGRGRGGRRGERVATRDGKSVKRQIRREDGLFAPLGLPIKHAAVDGLCYAPICQEELVKNRDLFAPRPDDCMVSTYPRSGTTWTLEIVRNIHLVQNKNLDPEHSLKTQNHRVSAPWINTAPMKEDAPSPRVLKTHNHYQHLNIQESNKTFRIIHVMRDPKDVLCSAYHHILKAGPIFDYQGSFDEFVAYFLEGRVESGNYWDFNRAYLENKSGFNILYLKYEELSKDKLECIRKINKFLGYEQISDEQLAAVDEPTRFEAMAGTQVPVMGDNVKGKVGQSKEMLNKTQRAEVIKQTETKMAGVELPGSYFSD